LPAGYLFHDVVEASPEAATGDFKLVPESWESEVWDLADLTLQCRRKGDALKLALGWVYYGSAGYGQKIEDALDITNYLSTLIRAEPDLVPRGPSSSTMFASLLLLRTWWDPFDRGEKHGHDQSDCSAPGRVWLHD
jgi:glutamate/tyrosine decarboxylase-like PLP-dependent enzyme